VSSSERKGTTAYVVDDAARVFGVNRTQGPVVREALCARALADRVDTVLLSMPRKYSASSHGEYSNKARRTSGCRAKLPFDSGCSDVIEVMNWLSMPSRASTPELPLFVPFLRSAMCFGRSGVRQGDIQL